MLESFHATDRVAVGFGLEERDEVDACPGLFPAQFPNFVGKKRFLE